LVRKFSYYTRLYIRNKGIIEKLLLYYIVSHLIILFSAVLFLRLNFFYALFFSLSKDLGIILYLIRNIKVKDSVVTIYLYFYGLFIISFSLLAILFNISFINVFGFKWDFIAVIEYVIFGLLLFSIIKSKLNNAFKSFAYSFILITILGSIYELPISYTNLKIFFHYSYPFFIQPTWILLGVFIYKKFKMKRIPKQYNDIEELLSDSIKFSPILFFIAFFFIFSIFKFNKLPFFRQPYYDLNKVFLRIPTFLVFLVVIIKMRFKNVKST